MFDPVRTSKSPLSSRIALPMALFLAGGFGLAIATLQPLGVSKKTLRASSGERISTVEYVRTDVPVTDPVGEVSPAAEENLIQFCSRHVTAKRSFVVFKRGTCVVITEPCINPMREAREILARCNDANARFVSEATSEGDLIVAFREPVFHRFTPAEMAEMDPDLVKTASGLLSPEESVLAGDGWTPPANARFGLVARRKMLEDAAKAVPLRIVRARERALVAR